MNNLQILLNMRELPFFDSNIKSEENRKMAIKYFDLEEKIGKEASKLKKGDKVYYIEDVKVKHNRKGEVFNFDLISVVKEAIVYKSLYNKKRNTYGEETLIPTIKVETATHIIEISPENVCKK